MEKINFQDLPSTSTPLNSTNLNQMQDNMEYAINEQGIPTGGTAGQVLSKNSNTDYDVSWITQNTNFILDSIDGTATDKAPSQRSVNEAISELSYNLVTGGPAVKTGRKIDGKDEYVKRFDCGALPNNTSKYIATDLNLNTMLLTGMSGVSTNANKTFAYFLPNTVNNEVAVRFDNTGGDTNQIIIVTNSDRSAYTETYIDITFIYR